MTISHKTLPQRMSLAEAAITDQGVLIAELLARIVRLEQNAQPSKRAAPEQAS